MEGDGSKVEADRKGYPEEDGEDAVFGMRRPDELKRSKKRDPEGKGRPFRVFPSDEQRMRRGGARPSEERPSVCRACVQLQAGLVSSTMI